MAKFQIGDKVRATGMACCTWTWCKGRTFTVTGIEPYHYDNKECVLTLDAKGPNGAEGRFHECYLELAEAVCECELCCIRRRDA